MTALTQRQIALARHALGLDGNRKCSYRNRFFTSAGSPPYNDWQQMVASGHALNADQSISGVILFQLTRSGAEAAMRKGESLCREDFPPENANSGAAE